MQHFAPVSRFLTLALVASLSVSSAWSESRTELLKNPGMESGKDDLPSIWSAANVPVDGLEMRRDRTHVHTGEFSLSISNSHAYEQQVANNWTQRLESVPTQQTIQLSGFLRTENADAVNICLQCWDQTGEKLLAFGSTHVIRGDQEWTRVSSNKVIVPRGTANIFLRASLTGIGKAWFDDLSVTIVDGPHVSISKSLSVDERPQPIAVDGLPEELLREVSGRVIGVQPVTKDSMVLSYLPRWSHGNVDNIAVANNQGGVRTLLSWEPLTLESPAKPDRRYLLALYSRKTTMKENPGVIASHEIRESWNEIVSWDTQPDTSDAPITTTSFQPGEGWKLFDVSKIVRNPKANQGVMLRFVKENESVMSWSGFAFASREALGEWIRKRPLLIIAE
ncbi:MAG: DNRLRE domain-containing protein [Planctomycetota bacterium]